MASGESCNGGAGRTEYSTLSADSGVDQISQRSSASVLLELWGRGEELHRGDQSSWCWGGRGRDASLVEGREDTCSRVEVAMNLAPGKPEWG